MVTTLTIGGVISLCVNLALGLFVYSKNTKRPINKYFALFSASIALWSAGSFLANAGFGAQFALKILRIFYVAAVFLPSFYIHFISHIVQKFDEHKRIIVCSYIVSAILGIFLITDMFIADVREIQHGFFVSRPGIAYYVFFVFMTTCTLYGLYCVFAKIGDSRGSQRARLKWMFVAQIIAQIAGFEYFSSIFRLWDHIPFDDYILVGHFTIMSYAILKHQFLDIEVIIKRTLVFGGLASFALAVFSCITFLTQDLLSNYVGQGGRLFSLFVSVFIIVLGYEPLRNFLINVTDRYLFQKKLDYRKLLKDASREMAAIKSLKRLARVVVAFLVTKARIKNAVAFVYSLSTNAYTLQASRPFLQDEKNLFLLEENNPLVQVLKKLQGPTEREALKTQIGETANQSHKSQLTACYEILEKLGAEAAIPSFLYLEDHQKHNHSGPVLRSILFLGPKKSDEAYTPEDLDVFHTLAQESAIAIENARLYDEAIEKTREVTELKVQLAEEQKKNVLAELTGGIAHEVNNPLSYSHYAATLIQRIGERIAQSAQNSLIPQDCRSQLYEDSRKLLEYAELINLGTGRIKGAVLTVENFSKKTEAEEKLQYDPINLKLIFPLLLLELKYKYRIRNQELYDIKLGIEKNVPELYGKQKSIEQVFINLISNAQEAMKGRVPKNLIISAEVDPAYQGFVHLKFQDTGCGIPKEFLKKIFEDRFTTKGKEGGSGIGLNVCKRIIDDHKGLIWAESTVGVGSIFHLTLPAWKGDPLMVNEDIRLKDER